LILYVNGDSHTAAAECVNPHAFACDDSQLFFMGRQPHPDNLSRSWGKLLSQRLNCGFHCDAESASSNDRIIRTTRKWLKQQEKDIYRTLYIIQWSTWEREEWLIDGEYFQLNASGIDDVPDSHRQQYKEFVANINWDQKVQESHEKIWSFHQELNALGAKHIFFNGNNDFSSIAEPDRKDWGNSYLGPYNPIETYNSVVSYRCQTVAPHSWHYGPDGHRVWAQYLTKYIVDNKLV